MGKHYKVAILISTVILAGAVRYLSANNNPRLDEIWSINNLRGISSPFDPASNGIHGMRSPFDAFRIEHDNNHILNTIYLYYLGNGNWWPKYHLLSILAGTASVGLIGWLGFQESAFAGISSLVFSALSIPLIVTSSEARGYALSIFFAIVSFALFKNYGKQSGLGLIIAFWISIILGLLSQLIFFYIYAAFLITSFVIQPDRLTRTKFKEFLLWHTVPSLFTLSLFFLFIKNLINGGAPLISPGLERFSLFMITALNLPYGQVLSIIVSPVIFIALLRWIVGFEKRQSREWIFHGIVVGIVPTAAFLAAPFFNPQYLSLSLPFIYLLLASMLSRLSIGGQVKFRIAVATLMIFVALSVSGIKRQIEFGPGQYLDMFQYAADHSRDKEVAITGNTDFRYEMLLDFYKPFVETNKEIVYISNQDKTVIPDWLILENLRPDFTPDPSIVYITNGLVYDLKQSFPQASVFSGASSFLYQRRTKI